MEVSKQKEMIRQLQMLITDSQQHTFNGNFEEAMNSNYRIIHGVSNLIDNYEWSKEELKIYTRTLVSVCKWTASAIKQRKETINSYRYYYYKSSIQKEED